MAHASLAKAAKAVSKKTTDELCLPLRFGQLQTAEDGRKLAAQVLKKMETFESDDTLWPWSIKAMYRTPHTPQDNVIQRCIERLQKTGTAEALTGFCSVLTDEIGQARSDGSGGIYYARVYRDLAERDVIGRPGPWPRMDDAPSPARSGESSHAD